MNVFIILSILIIIIGVLIMTVSSSVLFKFNWNKKTGLEKILMIIFYGVLLYIINIIYWFIKWYGAQASLYYLLNCRINFGSTSISGKQHKHESIV